MSVRRKKETGGVAKCVPWTEREEQLLRRNIDRMRYAEIARRLGRTVASVQAKAANLGLSRPPDTGTLCWACANAVPNREGTRGCSWSRRFEPVEGWRATETRLYDGSRREETIVSYHVRSCPEFEEG